MIEYLNTYKSDLRVGDYVEVTDNSGLLKICKGGVMEGDIISSCPANGHARTRLKLIATNCQLPSDFVFDKRPNKYILINEAGEIYFSSYIRAWV